MKVGLGLYRHTGFSDEAKRKAGEYFQQAIDADPNFAPAYIGLANSTASFSGLQGKTEISPPRRRSVLWR